MYMHYLGKRDPGKCLFSHAWYSPRPPTSDRNEILHGGWPSGDSSEVAISSKSVKRFRRFWGRNLPFAIDLAKSVGKRPNKWERANFNPSQLRKRLTDVDKIRTSELAPEDQPSCKISFRFYDVSAQATKRIPSMTEKTICGVHVSPGSAETLIRKGGTANHHSIAYSLSNMSVKNYQNRVICVEVIVCNISVVFETQCI